MSLSRTREPAAHDPKILQGVALEANGYKNFPITIPPCDHDREKRRLIYKAQSGQSTSTQSKYQSIFTWEKNKRFCKRELTSLSFAICSISSNVTSESFPRT